MKSISNLLSSLVSKQNTPFTQKLQSSSLMQNNPIILMPDILYLIECFEGFGPECNGVYLTGQEYLQQFFKAITAKQIQGFIAIKITLTIHLILYEFQIGEFIAEAMINEGSMIHIAQNQLFSVFVTNYLMYLMKLAQNLKLFYACKIGQYPIFDQESTYTQYSESTRDQQLQQFNLLKKQNNFRDTNLQYRNYQQKKLEMHLQSQTGCITIDQKILYLFKLHNLLNSCNQIMTLCINTLMQIEKSEQKNIFIEISCVLWNDCMVMYKFSTQELCKLLDSFRFMPLQQLLSIQQIYWATINSTNSIKWMFNNRKYFDSQNIVKQPMWFEENKKLSSELQSSIIDTKIYSVPDSTRNGRVQTPQAIQNQLSPKNIPQQPFTSRVGLSQNTTKTTIPKQPYFVANKKLQQQIEIQEPQSTRAKKQIMGSIFSDEQLSLSPRERNRFQQQ